MRAIRFVDGKVEVGEAPSPSRKGVKVRVRSIGMWGSEVHKLDHGFPVLVLRGHGIPGEPDDGPPVGLARGGPAGGGAAGGVAAPPARRHRPGGAAATTTPPGGTARRWTATGPACSTGRCASPTTPTASPWPRRRRVRRQGHARCSG